MAASAMITTLDEFEAEYRKGIGYRTPPRGSREASLDNIRRFGDGVGDYNPLYRDEAHAARSRFGMITAPPIFIYGASIGVGMAINGNIDGRRLSSTRTRRDSPRWSRQLRWRYQGAPRRGDACRRPWTLVDARDCRPI